MQKIGRYEIERELGRGAMGVVYLAHDPHLHRQVAVKTYALPEGVTKALAKEFYERFIREARAAASLSHPGIVTVFDAGEDTALKKPYIAMEFVPGQSLKQLMSRGGRLEPKWVFTFGALLAEALHVAHEAGIVHRDIKPANILLRKGDGAAKIADFGVARLKTSDLTQTGAAVGSPGYMSPEQVRCGDLDGRSDLFSLAVVLYEALCGQCPFRGEDPVSLAHSITHDTQVPIGRLVKGCPPALEEFFDRALSKDPAGRFPDGASFSEALVEAGRQPFPRGLDRTILDAVPGGPADTEPAPGKRPQAADGSRRGGGRSIRGVAIALLTVLVGALAGAGFFRLARTMTARAGGRESRWAPPAPPAAVLASPAREPSGHARLEPPVKSQAPRQPLKLNVSRGAEIHLTLSTPVGSSTSHAGDRFTAKVADPVLAGDRVAIPAGSKVHGRVRQVTPAKKGSAKRAGSVSLSFEKLVTPSGSGAPISAGLTGLGTPSQQKSVAIIAGTDSGGAPRGKPARNGAKSAAGTALAATTRGKDVLLPAGSRLVIKLAQPLTLSVKP